MSVRFQRRLTLVPGLLRLNLSGRGVSVTLGPPGFRLTFARDGLWLTLGLPGSGLSSRRRVWPPRRRA